jgi:hypothetical protein
MRSSVLGEAAVPVSVSYLAGSSSNYIRSLPGFEASAVENATVSTFQHKSLLRRICLH